MARAAIPINSLERWAEFRLSPRLRVAFRMLVVLATNAVLCLGVLACFSVVDLISGSLVSRGIGKGIGAWTAAFFNHTMPTLDGLVVLIYALSALKTSVQLFSRDPK